ncbi:MAG: hypothetical protein AB7E36_14495 [Salinivirgaceae bacterium]
MKQAGYFTAIPGILLFVYFLAGGLNPHGQTYSIHYGEPETAWEYPSYLSADALPLFYFNPEAGTFAVSLNNPETPVFKDSFKELKAKVKTLNYLLVQQGTHYVRSALIRVLKFENTDRIFPFHFFW